MGGKSVLLLWVVKVCQYIWVVKMCYNIRVTNQKGENFQGGQKKLGGTFQGGKKVAARQIHVSVSEIFFLLLFVIAIFACLIYSAPLCMSIFNISSICINFFKLFSRTVMMRKIKRKILKMFCLKLQPF